MLHIDVNSDYHERDSAKRTYFFEDARARLENILQQAGVSEGKFNAWLEPRTRLRKPIHSFGLASFSSNRRLYLILEVKDQSGSGRLVECTLTPSEGRQLGVYEKVKSLHVKLKDETLHGADFLRKKLEADLIRLHEIIEQIRDTRRKLKDVS